MEITQTKSNTNSHGPSSSLQRLQDYSSDCLTFSDTSHSSHTKEGALMSASVASPPSRRGSLMQKLRSLPSLSEISIDHSFKLELLEYRQNRSLRASPAVRNYIFSFFLSFLSPSQYVQLHGLSTSFKHRDVCINQSIGRFPVFSLH